MKKKREDLEISGTVTGVFGHRFVIRSDEGKWLANFGRKGRAYTIFEEGEKVVVKGRLKNFEIKVSEMKKDMGGHARIVKERDRVETEVSGSDTHDAIVAVEHLGFEIMGDPLQKPKYFVIRGRSSTGEMRKFDVNFDGVIRGQKAVGLHHQKGNSAILPM